MAPKKSKKSSLELQDMKCVSKDKENTESEDHNAEPVSGLLIKYKERRCLAEGVLFDIGAEWTTLDRSVSRMVSSMFTSSVKKIEKKFARKTCLIPYIEQSQDVDQLDVPSPISSVDELSTFSVDKDLAESEESEKEPSSPPPYRRRLEMVIQLLAENLDLPRKRLLPILKGKREKLQKSDFIHEKQMDRDLDVHIVFSSGNDYKGRLSRSCFEGAGRLQFANGAVYIGHFSNNCLSGIGRLEWPDDSWYEGNFQRNRRHGYGMFKSALSSQAVYIGNWLQGERHGHGRQYYNIDRNDYYEGEFCRNKRSGEGARRWADGQFYKGSWERDMMHGYGVMRFHNGTYRGQWQQGKMHGEGEYVWTEGEYNEYRGKWKRGLRHGRGMLRTAAGLVFRGTWERNIKQGSGTLVLANGFTVTRVSCGNDAMYLTRESM